MCTFHVCQLFPVCTFQSLIINDVVRFLAGVGVVALLCAVGASSTSFISTSGAGKGQHAEDGDDYGDDQR